MEADEVVKIAAIVKVFMLASIRASIKKGETVDAILNRFEYSTFSFDADGNLILIPSKR